MALGVAFGLLASLILFWSWPAPIGPEHNDSDHERTESSPYGHSTYHEVPKTIGERWAHIREKTQEDPVALYTAVLTIFTGLLGVATFALWVATRGLVKGADKTAVRQLRSYIAADPFHISSFDETHLAEGKFRITNNGRTPAYNLRHHSMLVVAPFPLPEGYVFPKIAGAYGPPTVVTPNTTFIGTKTAASPFTAEEIERIKNETHRIYFYGEILYETAFHTKCWTTFNASIEADKIDLEKLASNHQTPDLKVTFNMTRIGNDADRN